MCLVRCRTNLLTESIDTSTRFGFRGKSSNYLTTAAKAIEKSCFKSCAASIYRVERRALDLGYEARLEQLIINYYGNSMFPTYILRTEAQFTTCCILYKVISALNIYVHKFELLYSLTKI